MNGQMLQTHFSQTFSHCLNVGGKSGNSGNKSSVTTFTTVTTTVKQVPIGKFCECHVTKRNRIKHCAIYHNRFVIGFLKQVVKVVTRSVTTFKSLVVKVVTKSGNRGVLWSS